jgi:hypothetical protein
MKKNMWTKNKLPKFKASLIVLMMVLALFISSTQVAKAIPVEDIPKFIWDKVKDVYAGAEKIYKKSGEKILNTVLSNSLKRLAFDAATYVATAGEGQKPLFVKEEFGQYLVNSADSAAGDFIDGIGQNWGASTTVDLCKPADPMLTAKIGLGLVQYQKPTAPSCTATNLAKNWSSTFEKYASMTSGQWVEGLKNSFDPTGGEIGVAFSLFNRSDQAASTAKEDKKTALLTTGGWLDVRSPAGKAESFPGQSKEQLASAQAKLDADYVAKGNDPFISAANIFLNQLAMEAFQRGLRELAKVGQDTSTQYDFNSLARRVNGSSAFEGLAQYGATIFTEKLATIVKPRFDVRANYDVVGELATCPDKNNPGPNNCVIDDKFSQAVGEKLTVGEALNKGYLHGDWLITSDNNKENTYNLRSASILRKFRIVPLGWEQAINAAAAKNIRVTFQDLVSCFDGKGKFSADFNVNDQAWCKGLVDPNWVLKSPLSYCKKVGVGSQIIVSSVSSNETASSSLVVSRATDYCADEQTCIKEKADGSCDVYGYCNEEKRTWNFSEDSCQPVYNTCQTFTNKDDQQSVSLLENTLDYSTCSASNSGCKQYSYNGDYVTSTSKVNWNNRYSVYLNNQSVGCDASNEGCTKLLRGKPGWQDVNFIMNANFAANNAGDTNTSANWHWPIKADSAEINDIDGKALVVSGQNSATLYSDKDNSVYPKDLAIISGWSYTLSADVKLNSGDEIVMSIGDNGDEIYTDSNSWVSLSLTVNNTNNLNFDITAVSEDGNASFSVRNLKLSPNSFATAYTNYAAFPAYEKLLPSYLESVCYKSTTGTGDYNLRDDAPAVCANYAKKCNKEEVGCELFTSTKDLFQVAAKANTNDYCAAECVGYDTYLARASYFYGTSADNLIPANAKTCGAESIGCSSFTNLDNADAGGEKLEYYSKVRQCIKPNTPNTTCSDFYSWDNAQLKVLSLQSDSASEPAVVDDTLNSLCNKEIYNKPVNDPQYNPDCREFYNKGGKITYRLYTNTISCSDTCYTYRLNEKNIDKNLTESDCTGKSKSWDATQGNCYVCQSGGVWDNNQKACLYKVIPSEGSVCAAENVGCREYNGNNGNNLRLISSYGFDDGLNGFIRLENSNSPINLSGEATVKNGKSLIVSSGKIGVDVPVTKGAAYVIKFMAKAPQGGAPLTVALENADGDQIIFGGSSLLITGDNQWHLYELNISNLNHNITGEKLSLETGNSVLVDNIIINEVNDRYYLIKDSSVIPDVCYYDMSTPAKYQGPNYNLGCSQYKDRTNIIHNLHQFSDICQNSAVGCEQMIQTNNSSDYYGYNVNLNTDDLKDACIPGTPGCLEVKGHQVIYAVYDLSKRCNAADTGCTRFGYSKTSGVTTSWADAYKKTLPDTYDSDTASPLCKSNEVGCDTWSYSDGKSSYFKNPGLNTCVFKNNAWYKTAVKRCDANNDGKISDNEKNGGACISNTDCSGKNCIIDANEYACDITFNKTFGFGGPGGQVSTPSKAAGLCNDDAATCSEYIDPVSKLVNNIVYNPTAEDIDKDGSADKWNFATDLSGFYVQSVQVKPNKLYIIDVTGPVTAPVRVRGADLSILGKDNQLGAATSEITSTSSVIFYTRANTSVNVYRNNIATAQTTDKTSVEIREVIINYQLSEGLDTKTCNGVVNTDGGCILFNARTQSGRSGLTTLFYDAKKTIEGGSPVACNGVDCSANTVIKVTPDRTCSRWLSCQTYTEDPETKKPVCYSMGECDQLNDKNECSNFLPVDSATRDSKTKYPNATGYSLLDNYYFGAMKEVGQMVSSAKFDFEDNKGAYKACNSGNTINCVVLEPQYSGAINYPANGLGYLKVTSEINLTSSSPLAVSINQDYYINYLVNTQGQGDSGVSANLIVRDSKDGTLYSFNDKSVNGWTRVVHKIRISNTVADSIIRLYIKPSGTSPVYIDDVNIEPVLQVGVDQYVAKDCRLYASADSLTCSSNTNNVKKAGIFGYCLQHDPLNPGVCLMWYPIDRISAGTNNQSIKGYQNKFPAYYCSEVDTNFKFVKYIKPYLWKMEVNNSNDSNNDKLKSCNSTGGAGPIELGSHDTPHNDSNCGFCNMQSNSSSCNGDTNYTTVTVTGRFWLQDTWVKYMCVPKVSAILAGKKSVAISGMNKCNGSQAFEGWVEYDSFKSPVTVGESGTETLCGEDSFTKPSLDRFCSSEVYSEIDNTDPVSGKNIMIYDPTTNSVETLVDYQIKCNSFLKLIDEDGSNMAWTQRISDTAYNNTTPGFFNPLYLNYVRLVEDAPFGSAALPNGYSLEGSGPIGLRRTKTDSMPLAGSPYGCTGTECDHLGQDSNGSYCFLGDTNITLANGGSTCNKLWSRIIPSKAQAITTLNQLFNYYFGSYSLNNNVYVSSPVSGWTSFKGTAPSIFNLKVKFNDIQIDKNGKFNVPYSGFYSLEFNTKVDVNQQPLKQILVNWGDGSRQTITNVDDKPDNGNPHKLYHYYYKGDWSVGVTIIDNWNQTAAFK